MNLLNGKNGDATVGGTQLPLKGWNVNPNIKMSEFENSKTGGFMYLEGSTKQAAVTIIVDTDSDANVFATPTAIVIGATLTNVKCHIDGKNGTLYWNFPILKVVSTPQEINVGGDLGTRIECRTSGPFQYPGGATP